MWLTPVTTASTADKSMTPLYEGPSSDMAPEPRYVPPDTMIQVPSAVRQIFTRVSYGLAALQRLLLPSTANRKTG